jgi:thiopeptide-type bacteriocin biosynthesis protein
MLAAPHERFLADRLRPWIDAARAERRVRRCFFIRYGEGGGHLRLRLIPGPAAHEGALDAAVRQLVGDALSEGAAAATGPEPVCRKPYDRTEHYFGETAESVYAELLNEATTRLCLDILAGPAGVNRTYRWLLTVGMLHWLLRGTAHGEAEFAKMVLAGHGFAEHASASVGAPLPSRELPAHPRLDEAVTTTLARTRPLGDHRDVRRTVHLLRRVRARGPRGHAVATHALHLLCNKLGFSLHDEHEMFTAIRRLSVPALPAESAA